MREIAQLILKGNVVCFSGAGISAESGISTFRGKEGLWQKYDPNLYASIDGMMLLFRSGAASLSDFISDFFNVLLRIKPNYSHTALAQLEARGLITGVITQNIDDLHLQAGCRNVAQLHGNSYEVTCRHCGNKVKKTKSEVERFMKRLERTATPRRVMATISNFLGRCPKCNIRCQSGVVFYGQSLPEDEIKKSYGFLQSARTLLCIGTSGVVYPAASFPPYAKERGAKIITVNPNENNFDDISDFVVREKGVDFFNKLMPLL